MTAEEFLKEWTFRRPIDKHDREMPFFSWDCMIDFAEQYHEAKTKDVSAYYVNPIGGECVIVLAKNMADACDKLEESGIKEYVFVHMKSFEVLS